MNQASPLLFDVEGDVAVLTLNNPSQGNAITPEMTIALEEAWGRVENDPAILCVVMTGAGEKHFCTGAAAGALKFGTGGLQMQPYAKVNRFTARMCHVTKPVICVVNGLCNGGGLHFVADSDIVISTAQAAFMDTHVTMGQVSALESIGIARRAGLGAALLMGLAGKAYRMTAERAYQLGMVDLLEPTAAEALAKGRALAKDICANSPQAVRMTKRAIWASVEMPDPQAVEFSWEILKNHWAHPDFTEGPKAFMEKRVPKWNRDPNAR